MKKTLLKAIRKLWNNIRIFSEHWFEAVSDNLKQRKSVTANLICQCHYADVSV
jgi:hypothetical protein